MSDVFISYDSDDRAIAQKFAVALQSMNWTVWWDRQIPVGSQFDLVIEQQIASARCVVVLWSKQAVASRWVRAEASAAATRNVLVPVMIEATALPLEFRAVQTAMLEGWSGDTDDREFRKLTAAIAEHVGGTVGDGNPPPQPRRILRVVARVAFAILIAAGAATLWWATTPKGTSAKAERQETPETTPAAESREELKAPAGDGTDAHLPVSLSDSIGKPHEVDTYTFNFKKGRRVYFGVKSSAKSLFGLPIELVDERGDEVFRECLGCGDPGVHSLESDGRYTLTVGGTSDPATGAYELTLTDVPAPSLFDVAIGKTIGNGSPSPGAGTIESPGAEDHYRFTATPLQRVYFRVVEFSPSLNQVGFVLKDEDDTLLLETCLGCGDAGTTLLRKGGAYEIIVGSSRSGGTGSYRLRITKVPAPDQFAITLPARVEAGVPGEGAGLIEAPGAEDIYSFDLAEGQSLSLRVVSNDGGLTVLPMRVLDATGAEIANNWMGFGTPKLPPNLPAGAYRLVVGGPKNATAREYALEIAAR